MAELTALEEKLAEVTGLAMAAQTTTEKVISLCDDQQLVDDLSQMRQDAEQLEERCIEVAGSLDGRKTAILEKARETKSEAQEMRDTYLGEDADALDGFEFLTMAEAGEVGHWKVVKIMAERAGQDGILELAKWAEPIQERHFSKILAGSAKLAAAEDPFATG